MLDEVRIIAHRGNSAVLPGYTMAAFRSAWALGAHMIELDVRLSHDGFPVVIHDDTVDAVTTGHGAVAELRLSQLQRLGLPTLEDVLALPIALNVEIKAPAALQAVVDAVQDRADVVISSFDVETLDFLRKLQPDRPVAYLSDEDAFDLVLERAAGAGAYALNPARSSVTPERVARTHAAGLRVQPYVVNDPAEARRLFGWGVDAVFTDNPAALLAIL